MLGLSLGQGFDLGLLDLGGDHDVGMLGGLLPQGTGGLGLLLGSVSLL